MFSGKPVISRRYDTNIDTFATTLRATQSTLEHTDEISDIIREIPLSDGEQKKTFAFTPP